ncbi:hypothetical protein V8B97DRAFT_1917548 [Scleroderma yunnanense]
MAGFDPERFLEAIDKYRATIVLVVPPILVVLAHHEAYGLTEMSPAVFLLPPEYAYDHVGSVGLVLPNLEVRLIRKENGEGYLNNPTATAAAITPDGWLKTGDIARCDKDGFFTIVDRRKELIKYKDSKVSSLVAPAELESVLLQHPGVADVAVTGVENQEDATEFSRAYIVPSRIIPQRDVESFALNVQEWVAVRVAPHKKLCGRSY